MRIEEIENITVRKLIRGYNRQPYVNTTSMDGKLLVRPHYQREFNYKYNEQVAVIDSIIKGHPLNTFYWAKNNKNQYEVVDGQQRIISICEFIVKNELIIEVDGHARIFSGLDEGIRSKILNYKLLVYDCIGTDREKLEWYKVLNMEQKMMNPQEMRNATYSGPWVWDARRFFSVKGCPVKTLIEDYIKIGNIERQTVLTLALNWITNNGDIDAYMAKNADKKDASELIQYFKNVLDWVEKLFSEDVKELPFFKNQNWGYLYNEYKKDRYTVKEIEKINEEVMKLYWDPDVSNRGIFKYIFSRDEKYLNIRIFDETTKEVVYKKQKGICKRCGKWIPYKDAQADHIRAWSEGGQTVESNCQILCRKCNAEKGARNES